MYGEAFIFFLVFSPQYHGAASALRLGQKCAVSERVSMSVSASER